MYGIDKKDLIFDSKRANQKRLVGDKPSKKKKHKAKKHKAKASPA